MMTFRQFSSKPETIPAATSWFLADLGEARGKQDLFTRMVDIGRACPGVGREWIRTLMADLKKSGEVKCRGKGPAARWVYKGRKGSTPK